MDCGPESVRPIDKASLIAPGGVVTEDMEDEKGNAKKRKRREKGKNNQ